MFPLSDIGQNPTYIILERTPPTDTPVKVSVKIHWNVATGKQSNYTIMTMFIKLHSTTLTCCVDGGHWKLCTSSNARITD